MEEESIKLKDLQDLLNNKNKYKLNEELGHQGIADNSYEQSEGIQGEYDEKFIYYRHPSFPDNVFMKETYQTDSYGSNESLVTTEFVKGSTKIKTVYESV